MGNIIDINQIPAAMEDQIMHYLSSTNLMMIRMTAKKYQRYKRSKLNLNEIIREGCINILTRI